MVTHKITIKEPYWGAWKEFGWAKGVWGLGIHEKYLTNPDDMMEIWSEYHETLYGVSVGKVRENGRVGRTKPRGNILLVIPCTILDLIRVDKTIPKELKPREKLLF